MRLRFLLSLSLWTLPLLGACGSDPSRPDDTVEDDTIEEDAEAELDAGTPRPRDASARDAARDARVGDAPVRGDARAPSQQEPDDEGSVDASAPIAKKGRSAGCGKPGSATRGFEVKKQRVDDKERGYALWVPPGYDSSRAYPMVFRFHGTGGDGLQGGMDIQKVTNDGAIVVGPDGLDKGWTDGSEASDLKLFDSLLASLGDSYCVDLDKVYSYGFSAGAGFSELLACKRGSVLRGIAAIAGYPRGNGSGCQGPVAAWLSHDKNDDAVPLIGGTLARGRILQLNGCSATTKPEPSPDCVRYTECMDGYDVVWCETTGLGHNFRADFAPKAAWTFFSGL